MPISDLPADASASTITSSPLLGASARRAEKPSPCPRCHSLDTKFCYYNNHNVNQPRHFCRSCQRYWTAGGCLRNLPVGAGRRKHKSSSAKRPRRHEDESEDLGAVYDGASTSCGAGADLMGSPPPFGSAKHLCRKNEASFPSVFHGSDAKTCVDTQTGVPAVAVPPAVENDRRHVPSEASTESRALKPPTTAEPPPNSINYSFPAWNQNLVSPAPPPPPPPPPPLAPWLWSHPSNGAAPLPDATMLAAWTAAAAIWQFPFLFSPFGGGWPPAIPWNAPPAGYNYLVDPRNSSMAPHPPSSSSGKEPPCIPKTLKVGDPDEVTHSSILTALGLSSSTAPSSVAAPGFFNREGCGDAAPNLRTKPRQESQQKHLAGVDVLQQTLEFQKLLHRNPAAQARSLAFQENG